MPSLTLPTDAGGLARYVLSGAHIAKPAVRNWNRVAYAAAHAVADPRSPLDPWLAPAIDWDRTIAYREHLWRLGLGVAEAIDRKSTRLNSSHVSESRMPSSA